MSSVVSFKGRIASERGTYLYCIKPLVGEAEVVKLVFVDLTIYSCHKMLVPK